ncbi:glycosyltransferase family 2 protein [Muribacter muris]|uniref:Glycosyltransferase family 2 protein n=1 Tax=Muribacter muris TaxID=67855 RepID=A0A4Y9K2U2_9PAST|nr:glycosyltransferase family A protein [Muribacter muris]MBF0784799.1 glycosyltransferase family 2 protein [Muribacter muris]MBF0826642.1 glycosyltransferase family 2 protein [Muribacter muris]TFV11035.1 glycosyltransferase family 2 protein [Muribacter muris]
MIDVIIPCYNAEDTLQRAVQSALNQAQLGTLWLIDDYSTDGTFQLAKQFEAQLPHKIRVERLAQNGGAAKARNWGALQSEAALIAFLDADDAYENQALQVAEAVFLHRPEVALVRLELKPIDLAPRYAEHPNFDYAWQHMRMTGAGNTVFRRSFFLACGGFPQHSLFRTFGGEDGALGIATTQITTVATTFGEAGVLNFCREGMHAEHLLDAILFERVRPDITPEDIAQANQVTANICQSIQQLRDCLNSGEIGIKPLVMEWTKAD